MRRQETSAARASCTARATRPAARRCDVTALRNDTRGSGGVDPAAGLWRPPAPFGLACGLPGSPRAGATALRLSWGPLPRGGTTAPPPTRWNVVPPRFPPLPCSARRVRRFGIGSLQSGKCLQVFLRGGSLSLARNLARLFRSWPGHLPSGEGQGRKLYAHDCLGARLAPGSGGSTNQPSARITMALTAPIEREEPTRLPANGLPEHTTSTRHELFLERLHLSPMDRPRLVAGLPVSHRRSPVRGASGATHDGDHQALAAVVAGGTIPRGVTTSPGHPWVAWAGCQALIYAGPAVRPLGVPWAVLR